MKKELYKDGGATMSKEMREILDNERAEGKAEGRAEGRAEGKAEGKLQGMLTLLTSMIKKGILTVKMAADELGVTEKEFLKMAKTIS